MTTKWVVTSATERITLDGERRGEAAFTVTNPGRVADRAVFEVVPGTGADRGWFTVEEPQRLVKSGASVSYAMKVAVAPSAPAGTYEVKGRVYSVDAPPEEDFVDSNRVVLEVKPAPTPEPKRRPWWLIVVAALVAIVLAVVIWLVVGGDDAPPPPPPAGDGLVPDLTGRTEAQAVTALTGAGLKAGTIKHRHDPAKPEAVVEQSLPAGAKLPKDTTVNLVIQVQLAAPTLKTPANGSVFGPGAAVPVLTWEQTEAWPTKWQVLVQQDFCSYSGNVFAPTVCVLKDTARPVVPARTYTPPVNRQPRPYTGFVGDFPNGWVRVEIVAFDDFDKPGPAMAMFFLMRQY